MLRNIEFEEENRSIIALYRKIFQSRSILINRFFGVFKTSELRQVGRLFAVCQLSAELIQQLVLIYGKLLVMQADVQSRSPNRGGLKISQQAAGKIRGVSWRHNSSDEVAGVRLEFNMFIFLLLRWTPYGDAFKANAKMRHLMASALNNKLFPYFVWASFEVFSLVLLLPWEKIWCL